MSEVETVWILLAALLQNYQEFPVAVKLDTSYFAIMDIETKKDQPLS